jgi:hypothetical protein
LQEEDNVRIVILISYLFGGGIQECVQLDHADDRLVEIRCETDCLEFPDKAPLGCDQVIAKYIYLFCLLLPVLVEPFGQKTQSLMSLFITHDRPSSF